MEIYDLLFFKKLIIRSLSISSRNDDSNNNIDWPELNKEKTILHISE